MKFEVEYLDIVTIRSCQLRCDGCCTFSDHKDIVTAVHCISKDSQQWMVISFIF